MVFGKAVDVEPKERTTRDNVNMLDMKINLKKKKKKLLLLLLVKINKPFEHLPQTRKREREREREGKKEEVNSVIFFFLFYLQCCIQSKANTCKITAGRYKAMPLKKERKKERKREKERERAITSRHVRLNHHLKPKA